MKLVDKYLLREYLVMLGYCLLGFGMIFVITDLSTEASDFIKMRASPLIVLAYYARFLAIRAEYVVPASLMLATLYTLWQLTRHNELTAMRAIGIGLHRIVMPFLLIGLLFTGMNIAMKEFVQPGAAFWLDSFSRKQNTQSRKRRLMTLKYMNADHYREWTIDAFDFARPTVLHGVHITQERSDETIARKITADKAEWIDDCWWLHNAYALEYGKTDNPIGEPKPLGSKISMPKLTELPSDFANEIKPWDFLSSMEMKRYLDSHSKLSKETVARRKFFLHNRLAMPWACLIVTLFAIPAGAATGRQSGLPATERRPPERSACVGFLFQLLCTR
ncbi:LptF/LptG family permease [Verrucomicrobiota bacterium]